MRQFQTPMMQQYSAIKRQYPDALLFFRLGDFYELFMEDAELGAELLGITLTRRPRGKDGHIPMAGVPFHAADGYIAKLTKQGFRIAICEQVSDPNGRDLVERKVVRVISPSAFFDDNYLENDAHTYTASIVIHGDSVGVAVGDISTGLIRVTQLPYKQNNWQQVVDELSRWKPAECVLHAVGEEYETLAKTIRTHLSTKIGSLEGWSQHQKKAEKTLQSLFGSHSLEVFGVADKPRAIEACAIVLGFWQYTQQEEIKHVSHIEYYHNEDFLLVDRATVQNLELFETIRGKDKQGTLFAAINAARTPMGARLLRNWLSQPLADKEKIEQRQRVAQYFHAAQALTDTVRETLGQIGDIERIVSRFAVGLGSAARLNQLRSSLEQVMILKQQLQAQKPPAHIKRLLTSWDGKIETVAAEIKTTIAEDVSETQTIHIINPEVNGELDELREVKDTADSWLADYEESQRQKTGISSLKCRYNSVFGFYIEVSKANKDAVPKEYVRKQTLVNAERFITDELKLHEERVLTAEASIAELEKKEYERVVAVVLEHLQAIQSVAASVAQLDCLVGFAFHARRHRYVLPTITDDPVIEITAGRHPVVETVLEHEQFVPNDTALNRNNSQLHVITGPNMAGKSVYMRQVALITLLAHIGSFVPADAATIGITDRISIRSGASDGITSGLSTFMVEMVETAHILKNSTGRSLVILDEIGRGTSTFDGISIAWAVAESLVTRPPADRPLVLFATHYHELQLLADQFPQAVKNFSVAVSEDSGKPVFLHVVQEGSASHSYGLAVADLAGVPQPVIDRAQELLSGLEKEGIQFLGATNSTQSTAQSTAQHTQKGSPKTQRTKSTSNHSAVSTQLERELQKLEIGTLTPLDALNLLADWQKKLSKPKT